MQPHLLHIFLFHFSYTYQAWLLDFFLLDKYLFINLHHNLLDFSFNDGLRCPLYIEGMLWIRILISALTSMILMQWLLYVCANTLLCVGVFSPFYLSCIYYLCLLYYCLIVVFFCCIFCAVFICLVNESESSPSTTINLNLNCKFIEINNI